MRRWLVPASFLLPLTLSAPAFADDDCPPGSWFCEEVEVPQPNLDDKADAGDASDAQVDEPAQAPKKPKAKKAKKPKKPAADAGDKTVVVEGDGSAGGETVVIVRQQPGQRVVVVGDDGEPVAEPPPPPEPKKKRARRWRERFGLNLRLEGAAFLARDESAGLGGIGASFRWRPSPYFALDIGTDLVGGVDYDGNDRVEVAGSVSGLVYFNPQDRVQVYGIGGLHLSHAEVDTGSYYCAYGYCDWGWNDSIGRDYVGAHGGLGVEFRLSRHVGLHLDALALIREKIDDGPPEFVDAQTGETTNTSGAGLFRAGINFWW